MKTKRKSKSRRIIEAAAADGLSYVVGLAFPVPFGTIAAVGEIIKENTPVTVDWELNDWPKLYAKEYSKTLMLPFAGKKYSLPQLVLFDNVKRNFTINQIRFKIESQPYVLPDDTRGITEKRFQPLLKTLHKHGVFYNDLNLRLTQLIEEDNSLLLVVQPVEYQYYVHTNLLLDAGRGKTETLREHIHPNGELEDLSKSPLANNLGINILLFTADGRLIIKKRRKVAFRVGEWEPSASGGFNATDVPINLMTLAQTACPREALEELGIQSNNVTKLFLMGLTRELIRGGEPESFFVAQTSLTEDQVRKCWISARDRDESREPEFYSFGPAAFEALDDPEKVHGFLLRVDSFLEKYIDGASIMLLTAMAFWIEYRLQQRQTT